MADEPKKPAPAPKPVIDHAAQGRADVASMKTGHDPLRPFRYAGIFISGTIAHGLNDLARWANKGFKIGLGIGIVAAIATQALPILFTMTAIGFATGSVLGATRGLLTGGIHEVRRQRRGELYAEDLVSRAKIQKAAPHNKSDYRANYERDQAYQARQNLQLLTREQERDRDTKTYWQDRETHRYSDFGPSRW